MSLTVQDLYYQADYLVISESGQSIYFQEYGSELDELSIEYDDGSLYAEWERHTPVEATADGTVLILGTEYRAYVAQQVKFEPTTE